MYIHSKTKTSVIIHQIPIPQSKSDPFTVYKSPRNGNKPQQTYKAKTKQDKGIEFFFFFLNYTWSCFVYFYMNVN